MNKKDFSLTTGSVALGGIEECVKESENNMPVLPALVMTEEWEATERLTLTF